MLRVTAHIKSASHLIFGKRIIGAEKQPGETHDDMEKRVWPQKAHVDKNGELFIPAIVIKRALDSTAVVLGKKIPGKGNSRYAKVFITGVMAGENVMLGKTIDDCVPETILCSSDGKKGGTGGTQVPRVFPMLHEWEGDVELFILTNDLPEAVIKETLVAAGFVNGALSFRAQNGGMAGRWRVESFNVEEYAA